MTQIPCIEEDGTLEELPIENYVKVSQFKTVDELVKHFSPDGLNDQQAISTIVGKFTRHLSRILISKTNKPSNHDLLIISEVSKLVDIHLAWVDKHHLIKILDIYKSRS